MANKGIGSGNGKQLVYDIKTFIEISKTIHQNKYNYDNAIYVNTKTKVEIKCNTCDNIFKQPPAAHLAGHGCPHCSHTFKIDTKRFIEKAMQIHGDIFSYEKTVYVSAMKKVIIYCKKHQGYFEQKAHSHLIGYGCMKCLGYFKTTEEVIAEFKEVHRDSYDYSLVEYSHYMGKVKIICNKCKNIFECSVANHISGNGCPRCKQSKGEKRIQEYFKDNNIQYVSQYKTENCKNILKLPFDFAILRNDTVLALIEYQGIQHYKPIRVNGMPANHALPKFEKTQLSDKIKKEYCTLNNIPLLEIKYTDFNKIEEILQDFLKTL